MAKETESVVYATITNLEGLRQANTIEEQLQFEAKFQNGTPIRIRKTKEGYVQTIKERPKNQTGVQVSEETNQVVTAEFAEAFIRQCHRWLNKVRFTFNSKKVTLTATINGVFQTVHLPGLKFEVDCYKNGNDEFAPYCKIDIELDEVLNVLKKNYPDIKKFEFDFAIENLPFAPKDCILLSSATEEEKAKIGQMWDEHFNRSIEEYQEWVTKTQSP